MNKQTKFSSYWAKLLKLAPQLFCLTFFGIPANAIVVTSVSVNGVQLVSEAASSTFGLPQNLIIASTNGGFLFNFGLISDPSQNPDESTLGDSFTVNFFSNSSSELQAPNNYGSVTYYVGNSPEVPTSVSFTRQFDMVGIMDGGLSIHMSNSSADYYSPFSGYETNPVFHFTLMNLGEPVSTPPVVTNTTPPPVGSSGTTPTVGSGSAGNTTPGPPPIPYLVPNWGDPPPQRNSSIPTAPYVVPNWGDIPPITIQQVSLSDPGGPPPGVMETTPEPGTFGLMIAGVLLLAGKLGTGVRRTNCG